MGPDLVFYLNTMVATHSQVEHRQEDTSQPIENHRTPTDEHYVSQTQVAELYLQVQ